MANTPPVSESSPARAITPRRNLPNGRAVVGALLVTIAAVGAFLAANSGDQIPDTEYLVATNDVSAGSVVELADVELAAIDLPDDVATNAVLGTNGVEGAIALRDIVAGQLVSQADLIASNQVGDSNVGLVQELTIPVPTNFAPSSLRRGERVTVLATQAVDGTDTTVVAVEDAAVQSFDNSPSDFGANNIARLTLLLPTPELAVAVAHFANVANISVVRTTEGVDPPYPTEFQYQLTPEPAETPSPDLDPSLDGADDGSVTP